jgi:transcriptional regulator with XRE-family HTH domain
MDKDTAVRDRFVEWLKKRVGEDRGWQVRAAKLLGVSQGYLNAYTTGRANIGRTVIEKVASLGCDIDWLLTGSTNKPGEDVYFYAPKGVSDETRRRYARLARQIASIPPEEIDRIEEVLRLYFKIAENGKDS